MFEEIRVDFLNKPKKLNHRNVTSFATLNQQLKKAYELNTNYSLWYEDNGELMSIQNEYDFSTLDGIKKLKIIVLAEQSVTSGYQLTKQPKLQQADRVQQIKKDNVHETVKGVEREDCECQLLRTSGFAQMICLSCEKKQIQAAKLNPKKELNIRKSTNIEQKPILVPPPIHGEPSLIRQKPFKAIRIEIKPQVKIHIKPGKEEEFKENQRKIRQYLDLLSTHEPIRQQKQGNKHFTNLIDIAKLVLNYQPQQPVQKMRQFGKQLTQKYQLLHQIFSNESEKELLEFIGNNMEVPIDKLPQKYQAYKHWY